MSVDTAENRQYIQKHRLWILGDAITCKLITEQPSDPFAAALSVLEGQRSRLQAPPNQPTTEELTNAKDYLEKGHIATLVEDWLRHTLESKPDDAVQWSIDYFNRLANDDEVATTDTAADKTKDEGEAEAEALL
jgi:hypothetical protein